MHEVIPSQPSIQESACRQRLIEAARNAFLKEGYRGASVDRIAADAGVAKQTFYNQFAGKDEVFTEVVRLGMLAILVSLDGDRAPLRERLRRFAVAFREKVLGVDGLAFYRAVMAEATRFPELARSFYAQGPARTVQRLAAILEQAMDAGQLRRDDPVFAAQLFTSMLVESERTRRLMSGTPVATPNPADAERILDAFMRAFTPDANDPQRSQR